MTASELASKWEREAAHWELYAAQVDAGRLCRAFLADVQAVINGRGDEILTLREAAAHSGYSAAHLRRLTQTGHLQPLRPVGSRGRLTFRRGDLPRKPGRAHTPPAGVHELASRLFGGKEGRRGQS